ncbi:type VII secretion protein EccCa [Corynebacterium liangguodongii]|uniref:Type VII secretion protein EccC n=1 Tax=Corynebacterium liangguodongii TaxID=2079535 RepID=A0A2S0WCA6_9CORY|nr:type VII secretion protein EccCa [Corynebacterium liangguodongii]AWB83407.1 type VII secretion protein EccC [Corynebacterium liangguodongii]PWC00503.1 type VII secretion protein EccCa [Corynebacterium liangguodongii]
MLGLDRTAVLAPQHAAGDDQEPPLPEGSLAAEPIPEAQRDQPQPIIKILMPIIMIAAIGAMVAVVALSGREVSPTMAIFPLMMGLSALMMINPPEKAGDIDETRRVYLRHLGALAESARTNADRQRAHASYLHPAPSHLLHATATSRVWERGHDSPRALHVRFGEGTTSLCTPVHVADPGSPEDLDPVCAVSLRRMVAAVGTVAGMPIVINLAAFPSIVLTGAQAHEVARAALCQLCFFHGPEVAGLYNLHKDPDFEWVKWFPHTRAPHKAAFAVALADRAHAHAALMSPGIDCVIAVDQDPDYSVDEDSLHLVCEAGVVVARTLKGDEELGCVDTLPVLVAELIARHLAFYRRPESSGAQGAGGLMSMLGFSDIDELDEHSMWRGRAGTRHHLVVPFGSTPDGGAVHLDLKEAAHGGMGPHGLCIGATGSGKSELLRTLVTALAATHSPEELNVVLVDFKGGATFLGCEDLPHTAAVITNLEAESVLVERMFDAISGELNRRQELLREAGNFANVTDYFHARQAGRADVGALPSLLIIVDEFSELLGQHPHFADLFVAVGRLGRSLGVHLLLASQRLEEGKLRGLDSHLSYRIGLKTFSAGESRQVLGVPDAYELPGEPGSGYLKTGSTELVRFRAAYVSGPLERRVGGDEGHARPAVALFTGWSEVEEDHDRADIRIDESTTLLAAVVGKARSTARVQGMSAHQVWLPPLPEVVELSTVCESPAPLQVSIGLIDDPYHQRQDPAVIDFSHAGGHVAIAGGPRTGKSMALRTIVAALAVTHTTSQVCFYVIDAGAGGLADLECLPHVAGVATPAEEDKCRRIVDEMLALIDAHATAPQDPAARRQTFLVLDGWHSVFAPDSSLEDLRDALARIASAGPAAGVHIVTSTQRWSAIRANVRDLIGTRLELHLSEPADSLLGRKAQQQVPARPGRGLNPHGRHMLIAATAPQDLAHIAAQAAGQPPAPRLKVLPAAVSAAALLGGEEASRLPFARGGRNLDAVCLEGRHLVAIGVRGSGKSTLLATLIAGIDALPRDAARMVIIDPRRRHIDAAGSDMVASYAASSAAVRDTVSAAVETLRSRLPGAGVSAAELAERSWWEGPDIYLIIDDADLVAEADVAPLLALLPHARDIGLHVIVARKLGGTARALYGGLLGAVKDLNPDAVLLSGNRDEGSVFGVKPEPLPAGRGRLVRDGVDAGFIQVATLEAAADAGEE